MTGQPVMVIDIEAGDVISIGEAGEPVTVISTGDAWLPAAPGQPVYARVIG